MFAQYCIQCTFMLTQQDLMVLLLALSGCMEQKGKGRDGVGTLLGS